LKTFVIKENTKLRAISYKKKKQAQPAPKCNLCSV